MSGCTPFRNAWPLPHLHSHTLSGWLQDEELRAKLAPETHGLCLGCTALGSALALHPIAKLPAGGCQDEKLRAKLASQAHGLGCIAR